MTTERLWDAVRRDDVTAARVLLRRGANANARDAAGRTPAWLCAWHNLSELLCMLDADFDLADDDGDAPLAAAARNGSLAALTELLARRVKVDHANSDAQTALWHAANNGHARVVVALARAGALFRSDALGRDPLFVAAQYGRADVVAALLREFPAYRAERPCTPLHVAIPHVRVVRLLVEHAAVPLDSQDDDGRTPLWLAARDNCLATLTLLLDAGADSHATAHSGRTAREIADMYGHHDARRLLESYVPPAPGVEENEPDDDNVASTRGPSPPPDDDDDDAPDEEPTPHRRGILQEAPRPRVFDKLPQDLT